MTNLLTIDVEDYPWIFFRDYLGTDVPISVRVKESTQRIMDVLERGGVGATFFCLGNVALAFPELICEIHRRGFEVASHGMNHLFYRRESIERIREDIVRAKSTLEDTLGAAIRGFRAPHFGVSLDHPEVLECIVETGHVYDSSIFPFAGRRYGSDASPRAPYRLCTPSGTLIEFPLATVELGGRRWPVAGGGYLRHFPYRLTAWAIRHLNGEGIPATVYLHPYETDTVRLTMTTKEFRIPPIARSRAAWFNLHQHHGRGRVVEKLEKLIRDFAFSAAGSAADSLGQSLLIEIARDSCVAIRGDDAAR